MRVLVSIPNTGWIHKLVMQAGIGLLGSGYDVTLIVPTWKPYEHNMNRIAKDFLAGGFDYWLNIDADNPPTVNPLDAIGNPDHHVIGFPTPVWRDDAVGVPIYWNAMEEKDDGYTPAKIEGGIQEVAAVGSGCVLFSSEVVRAVREKYGPPFVRTCDDDGLAEFGPDFFFCRMARTLGYGIYVDGDRPCRHYCEIDLMTASERYGDVASGK